MTAEAQPDLASAAAGQATLHRFTTIAALASAGAGIVAATGLLAYVSGLRTLGSIRSDYIPMAPSTAVALLVLGVTLCLQSRKPRRGAERLVMVALVLLVTTFASLEAVEPLVGKDISLEDRLIPELGMLGGFPVGRMSPVTGVTLVLAGLGILLLLLPPATRRRTDRSGHYASSLGVLTATVAASVLLAYVYGTPMLYNGAIVPMAATTSIALLFLGAALVAAAGPMSFPTRLVVGESTAARLARAFVPLIAAAIFLHGTLYHVGHTWGVLNDALLASLAAVVVGVTTAVAAAHVARATGMSLDQSVRALRESEARYRAISQSANDAIVTSDSAGIIVGWNPAAENAFGYTESEAIGRPITVLMPEEFRTVNSATMSRIIAGEEPRAIGNSITLTGLRKDGSEFPLEISLAAWKSGETRFVTGIIRDVTSHRLAEAQLRRSEESLAITLQSIGDAVIATDEAGRITRMNATAERLTGWSLADAAGRPGDAVFRIVDTRERTPKSSPVLLALESGSVVTVAGGTTLLARDGREFQIADSAAPIRDSTGQKVGVVLVFSDVSEEYRVRRALADSADLLERTGQIAKIGGWQLDLRTNELVWSQETCRIHEVDPAEALTVERAINFYEPEARPIIQAAVQATIDDGTAFDLELPLTTAKGRSLWVRAQGSAVQEDGKTVALHGAFQDITDRWQAEEALRWSEEWHRTILQTAMAGFWLVDTQGRLLEVNDAYCRMSGYSAQELLAMRIPDLEVVDTSERIDALREQIMAQGEVSLEGRHRRKDGTLFDVDIRVQYRPVRGGLFVTLLQDITARKQAEQALAKSEELFRTIFAEAPLGVAVIDSLTGQIHEVNLRFAGIAGRTEAEVTTLDWMSITHPDDVQQDLDYMARMNAGEIPGFSMVKRYRRPDGSYVWINMTIAKMTTSRNGHPQHLCMIEDITARKRAEQEQASMQEQLTQMQKMESIGLLAGGVAHDFNNMLAAILGYAELTLLKVGNEHPAYSYVEAIRKAAERSTDLTGRLLAFARKQAIAPKVLDLNDTINSILTILHRLLGEQVRLAWTPGAALWSVEADPTHVDQVLTNLVVNARDAMKGRDGVLTIFTSNVALDNAFVASHPGAYPGEFVHVCCRDNGSGMDAQTRSRVFEPFFTTKAQGEGTGLGLSTVFGIMTQHGGFVDVDSTIDMGTAFHLYFPRTSKLAEEIAQLEKPVCLGTETILLVEDEEGVRESTAEMLRSVGYTVLATSGGTEAMALAARHSAPIHLLLTDVVMPGMNGAQLRDALVTRSPALRVLFMSGYAGNILSSQGELEPGTRVIQKPFTMQALAEEVRRELDS